MTVDIAFDMGQPYDIGEASAINNFYVKHIVENMLDGEPVHSFNLSKTTQTKRSEILKGYEAYIFATLEDSYSEFFYLKSEKSVTCVHYRKDSSKLTVTCTASSMGEAKMTVNDILGIAQEIPDKDGSISVSFWNEAANGNVSAHIRRLEVSPFSAVDRNYPEKVRVKLDEMTKWDAPQSGGKLVLFHGEPGTGKTSFIRSLASEWKSWAKIHYVVDPENFFGHAHYMINLLLADNGDDCYDDDGMENRNTHWRVLIVEDADKLIASDSKSTEGQALPRLLNLCDGLIGQGLKIIVLMTTNTKIVDVNDALTRPGRILAEIHFDKFSVEESDEWLETISPLRNKKTLADLYEEKNKIKVTRVKPTKANPIGFGSRLPSKV